MDHTWTNDSYSSVQQCTSNVSWEPSLYMQNGSDWQVAVIQDCKKKISELAG